jgi:hypothetical protein
VEAVERLLEAEVPRVQLVGLCQGQPVLEHGPGASEPAESSQPEARLEVEIDQHAGRHPIERLLRLRPATLEPHLVVDRRRQVHQLEHRVGPYQEAGIGGHDDLEGEPGRLVGADLR